MPGLPDDRRRFTLADAMVLVAAMAPAFALIRLAHDLGLFAADPRSTTARIVIEYMTASVVPLIACLMLVPFGLGLLDRRAGRRESTAGAGFLASASAMAAWPLPMAYLIGHWLLYRTFSETGPHYAVAFNNTFARLTGIACPMILGAWLAMLAFGRWRILPTWPDRLGIALALHWLLAWAYSELYFIAQPIRILLLG